ncbi:GCN5 family acetyltransferase [Paraburkholderia ginsengiterrae]|uniref:GCN5 family acetyltransferase n=1 Tax=Paraburkholderia ginsengiterrae TaxID=1462993 RepID=A0A1A9N380_9BURK|nr:GNAT family N-acetyltransferase [Paraburkholderia ginsengiterrae]OAJ56819.1 GCN5 family acetyltransferase [Paraburkholderia ginsengiterrae]OAJ56878.1 GCN5 family acetyltransferase [Paraburkholderia ginsengiterrae]
MIEPVRYRRATLDDTLKVCELGQILNSVHHQARPDIYVDATTEFERDKSHWEPFLQADDRATFLAEQDGTAVGFIAVQVVNPISPLLQPLVVGRICSIAVADGLRGHGVGKALMNLAEDWAREKGATDIRLAVWAFNEHAVDLYTELGYEVRAFEMGRPLTSVVV